MKSSDELKQLLQSIDHKGYPAYKGTKGSYRFPSYILNIEHVQGDPFASPSSLSIHVAGKTAGFPKEYFEKKHTRIALQDMLIRLFGASVSKFSFQAKGSGKSGAIFISQCGQEVLERSACEISPDGSIIMRFEVGFPANGRTINARELIKILFQFLPTSVEQTLFYRKLNAQTVLSVIQLAEDQNFIRQQLPALGLVAFVADGAVLPRASGISDKPMKNGIPFVSPDSMRITLQLPHKGAITGMGIRKGITLIVGGGYHGKSTLLKALETGVYPHIAGDGREYVITDDTAMKLRAEDGRSIYQSDISMFINDLPNGKDTTSFSTEDASGSTSQAANTIEAIEAGADVFLIDEDTSATNFMVRDELMQEVVCRDMEPITPFIERVRTLYKIYGISTILVAGSSGSYFTPADQIIQMERYIPREITEFAKESASRYPALRIPDDTLELPSFKRYRKPDRKLLQNDRIKLKTLPREGVMINHNLIDLRCVEQLLDSEQLTCLGQIVKYIELNCFDGQQTIQQIIEKLSASIDTDSFHGFIKNGSLPGNLAMPRKQEIYACLNRYRF